MECPMIKTKIYGTDLIGITLWKAGSWLRCIEFNTFIIDTHFYADKAGEIKIVLGLFKTIYIKVGLQIGNGGF
tara:strand:- start:6180 stop:6398 length:219 start_codon:yes stop_codon:yes gene_type:complete